MVQQNFDPKNMRTIFLLLCLPLFAGAVFAQDAASDLDFWLGDWSLRWQDSDSTEATGTNHIIRELGNKVISENFEAQNGAFAGFIGRSWSVYDTRTQRWKQTWVDNQGGYLDFIGGKDGDTFVFSRKASTPNGKELLQKMVFHAIETDRFTWDWMRSTDGGENWKLLWRIYYSRR